jgi:hypothetical protein
VWDGVDEPDEYDEPELERDEVEVLDELDRLVDALDRLLDEELDERELLPLLGREELLKELPPPGRASDSLPVRSVADEVKRPRSQVRRFMKRLPRQQARWYRRCGAGENQQAIVRIRGRLVRRLRGCHFRR